MLYPIFILACPRPSPRAYPIFWFLNRSRLRKNGRGLSGIRQLGLDFIHKGMLEKAEGAVDAIDQGLGARIPVTFDDHAFDPAKDRAGVFGVMEAMTQSG